MSKWPDSNYTDNPSHLEHTTDALNVINKFHNAPYIVFVEGQDDVPFWRVIFKKAGFGDCYIDDVDGIEELKKLIWKIINEDARLIVACDCHHSPFIDDWPKHNRIVTTYGYSIENTMYCPRAVNRVINNYCRDSTDRSHSILKWLNEFSESFKQIIIFDIANAKYKKSVKVILDNCSRFLKSSRSHVIKQEEVLSHIQTIAGQFSDEEFAECTKLVEIDGREARYLIRGYFLTHGVINFIKNAAREAKRNNFTLPLSSLYALTIDGCDMCTIDCFEYGIVKERIQSAINSILQSHK